MARITAFTDQAIPIVNNALATIDDLTRRMQLAEGNVDFVRNLIAGITPTLPPANQVYASPNLVRGTAKFRYINAGDLGAVTAGPYLPLSLLGFGISNDGSFLKADSTKTNGFYWTPLIAADYPVFLPSGAGHSRGAVPDPGATQGTTRFLREDATWATVPTSASGTTSWTYSIANKRWELFDSTIVGWLVAANPSLTLDASFGPSSFVDEGAVVDARLIAGGYPWFITTSGAGTGAKNGEAFRITQNAQANTTTQLVLGSSVLLAQTQNINSAMMVFDVVQSDANTTDRLGLSDTGADPPANGIYLECLNTDTNWFLVTRAANVQTRSDTGVARAVGKTSWAITVTTTSVSAYVVGTATAKATNATNIPAAATLLGPLFQVRTAAVAAKQLDIYHATFIAKQVGY